MKIREAGTEVEQRKKDETRYSETDILPNRLLSALLLRSLPNKTVSVLCMLSSSITDELMNTELTFPIPHKVLAEVRDAALKYKEGNPVWADTCNNLAKSAELFLDGYGPCEEYYKYSKPEVLAL